MLMSKGRCLSGVCGLCSWRIGIACLKTRASYVLRYQVGWVRMIVFESHFDFPRLAFSKMLFSAHYIPRTRIDDMLLVLSFAGGRFS